MGRLVTGGGGGQRVPMLVRKRADIVGYWYHEIRREKNKGSPHERVTATTLPCSGRGFNKRLLLQPKQVQLTELLNLIA